MAGLTPTSDEAWLIARCASGEKADFEGRAGPADGQASGARPVLRAEVLRRLVLGLPIEAPPAGSADTGTPLPAGLHIRGALIEGPLRLADACGTTGDGTCGSLIFEDCGFSNGGGSGSAWPRPDERLEPAVDLRHARCGRLAFVDCELAAIALDGAWIGGDLDLAGMHAGGAADRQCRVCARGAIIGGTLTLSRARLRLEPAPGHQPGADVEFACDLRGARVGGHLLGRDRLEVDGGLALPIKVDGDVNLEGARLACALVAPYRALVAQQCEIGGAMLMRPMRRGDTVHRFECTGQMALYGARIGGALDLSGALLRAQPQAMPDSLVRAYMLNVRGSAFVSRWEAQFAEGEETPVAHDVTLQGLGVVDFRNADIGGDLLVRVEVLAASGRFLGGGMSVAGSMVVEEGCGDFGLRAARIGRDLSLQAAESSEANADAADAQIGANCWLNGTFARVDAWGASVRGEFGSTRYSARELVAADLLVHGIARFNVIGELNVSRSRLLTHAYIVSNGDRPGASVDAANIRSEHNLVVSGPCRKLTLNAARIGGELNLAGSSVNDVAMDDIHVSGTTYVPRHIFGAVSMDSGRFEGNVHLGPSTLHVRRRAEGDTRPRLDLRNAHIEGDLRVDALARKPAFGVTQEQAEAPAWIKALAEPVDGAGAAHVELFRHETGFYESAEVLEFHVSADDASAGGAPAGSQVLDIDVYAFLLVKGTQVVALTGESQPIHEFNGMGAAVSPTLRLNSPEQAVDYLRFFCGYVWGPEGAFVIVDQLAESEWLKFAERGEGSLATLPAPPQIRREAEDWVCQATVMYADQLFRASLKIKPSGLIEMTDDVAVASLRPQGVDFQKPRRRYRWSPAAPDGQAATPAADGTPVHHTPHRVIPGEARWTLETDAAQRQSLAGRIRDALTTTTESDVLTDPPIPTSVELRGCHCESLVDAHGDAWGQGLTVDLRGFEYAELEEGERAFNTASTGQDKPIAGAHGVGIGQARHAWLERVTEGVDFSVTPYEQLVRAFARRGDHEAARIVLERRLQMENRHRPRGSRLAILLGVQWPFRFGLFSRRGLVVTLAYLLLGIYAFDIANYGQLRFPPVSNANSELIVARLPLPIRPVLVVDSQPVTMNVLSTDKGDTLVATKVAQADNLAEEVRCGDQVEPSLYALDIMLPLVDLHQESKCVISSADGWGPLAWRLFRAAYALVGAYMTSMLILTLSGVLRRSIER